MPPYHERLCISAHLVHFAFSRTAFEPKLNIDFWSCKKMFPRLLHQLWSRTAGCEDPQEEGSQARDPWSGQFPRQNVRLTLCRNRSVALPRINSAWCWIWPFSAQFFATVSNSKSKITHSLKKGFIFSQNGFISGMFEAISLPVSHLLILKGENLRCIW